MPKNKNRIKMLTSKWHREEDHFFKHPFRQFQSFGLWRTIFMSRTIGKGVEEILDHAPFSGTMIHKMIHFMHTENWIFKTQHER